MGYDKVTVGSLPLAGRTDQLSAARLGGRVTGCGLARLCPEGLNGRHACGVLCGCKERVDGEQVCRYLLQ